MTDIDPPDIRLTDRGYTGVAPYENLGRDRKLVFGPQAIFFAYCYL